MTNEEWEQYIYTKGISSDWRHLYGDLCYHKITYGDAPAPITIGHDHNTDNSVKGYEIGYLSEIEGGTICNDCDKKFPPRSKLETMIGLKEVNGF